MAGYQTDAWYHTVETDPAAWTILWHLNPSKNGCPAVLRAQPATRAWLKPRRDEPWVAAREKVTADLAHALGLPHASVVLAQVMDPDGRRRPVALSRYARAPSHLNWSRLQQRESPALIEAVQQWFDRQREMLAGVWVFDTWLHNRDRSDRNVMVGYDQSQLRAVYLYDADMSQNWQGDVSGGRWEKVKVVDTPAAVRRRLRPADLESWIRRILTLPEQRLQRLIDRLPDRFATATEKELTLRALLVRRQKLAPVFDTCLRGGS